ELPLEMATFDRDLESGAPARHVAEDVESAEENGVGDTPTFFVNGRMHEGSYEFRPLLDALRARRP
ncbi:MAG: DsbA family protein, partial [Thermoplasmata archaeon]